MASGLWHAPAAGPSYSRGPRLRRHSWLTATTVPTQSWELGSWEPCRHVGHVWRCLVSRGLQPQLIRHRAWSGHVWGCFESRIQYWENAWPLLSIVLSKYNTIAIIVRQTSLTSLPRRDCESVVPGVRLRYYFWLLLYIILHDSGGIVGPIKYCLTRPSPLSSHTSLKLIFTATRPTHWT